MNPTDADVFVFDRHAAAEAAIRTLSQSGFDMQQLPLVGKGCRSEERPIGCSTVGDRIVHGSTVEQDQARGVLGQAKAKATVAA